MYLYIYMYMYMYMYMFMYMYMYTYMYMYIHIYPTVIASGTPAWVQIPESRGQKLVQALLKFLR